MVTATQDLICEALGFEAPEAFGPWYPGEFSRYGTPIIIRHLPYLPEVNGVLRAHGFRWDAERKEWYGSDETEAQVSVIQALHYCAGRTRPNGSMCPVQVGVSACD